MAKPRSSAKKKAPVKRVPAKTAKKITPARHDDFPRKVIEELAKRVNYFCSKCGRTTSGPHSEVTKSVVIGEAAHIHSPKKNGPRYAPLTKEEIRSIENGIWLCRIDHRLVDRDPERFPADMLRSWKAKWEALMHASQQGLLICGPGNIPLAAVLELDEARLYVRSDHRIITTEPGFLHRWILTVTISFIPEGGATLTVMGKRCSARVYRTERSNGRIAKDRLGKVLLEFGIIQILDRDYEETPLSDLSVNRPMEVRFYGSLKRDSTNLAAVPINELLWAEFIFCDATETCGAVVPFVLEWVESQQRWHAGADRTKYRLEPLESTTPDGKGGNVTIAAPVQAGSGEHGPGGHVYVEAGKGRPGGDVQVIGASITAGAGGTGPGGNVIIKAGDGR